MVAELTSPVKYFRPRCPGEGRKTSNPVSFEFSTRNRFNFWVTDGEFQSGPLMAEFILPFKWFDRSYDVENW